MKTIVQNSNFTITLNRFDNNKEVVLLPNVPCVVDDETADFAIRIKCFGVDESGVDIFDNDGNRVMSEIILVE